MVRMEAVRRELRGSALALVLVAATTLVAYVLIQSFDVRRGSVIPLPSFPVNPMLCFRVGKSDEWRVKEA